MITSKWSMGSENMQDAKLIRTEVFINEQHIPPQAEFDALDERALHLVLYDDGTPAATGRLYYSQGYRIGRIAVRKHLRGKHFGDLLVRMLLVRAFNDGADSVTVSAQTRVVPFYERYGLACKGEPYTEDGIEHILMEVTPQSLKIESKCGSCTKDGCPMKQ